MSEPSFLGVLEGLRCGQDDAATIVHRRFVRRLVALAERQFDHRLRARADYEDVVQSAFLSAFRRIEHGEYDLGSWGALWGLLTKITLHKCGRRRDYLRAGRRGAGREDVTLSAAIDPWTAAADREPSPEEATVLAEIVADWLQTLSPMDHSVIELGLQGEDDPAIARRLLRTERSVRRVRLRAENQLRRVLCPECQEPGEP
jgi:RNA polymerase sigma factor (sigma-70 family)